MRSITPKRKNMAEQKSEDVQQPRNTNSTNQQPPKNKKNKSHPHLSSWHLESHPIKAKQRIEEPRATTLSSEPLRSGCPRCIHTSLSAASKRESVMSNELELQGIPLEGIVASLWERQKPNKRHAEGKSMPRIVSVVQARRFFSFFLFSFFIIFFWHRPPPRGGGHTEKANQRRAR